MNTNAEYAPGELHTTRINFSRLNALALVHTCVQRNNILINAMKLVSFIFSFSSPSVRFGSSLLFFLFLSPFIFVIYLFIFRTNANNTVAQTGCTRCVCRACDDGHGLPFRKRLSRAVEIKIENCEKGSTSRNRISRYFNIVKSPRMVEWRETRTDAEKVLPFHFHHQSNNNARNIHSQHSIVLRCSFTGSYPYPPSIQRNIFRKFISNFIFFNFRCGCTVAISFHIDFVCVFFFLLSFFHSVDCVRNNININMNDEFK